MNARIDRAAICLFIMTAAAIPAGVSAQTAVALPENVKAVWDAGKAWRETTATRDKLCINGLWRWQPAKVDAQAPPQKEWGYFKVPGSWPGISNYAQKDSQTLYRHPAWKDMTRAGISAAWYQREATIPADWANRRIAISIDTLNSFATIYVDAKKAGEIRFPAGELDLTQYCQPGKTHLISVHVVALPLKAILQSFTDSASAKQVRGSVPRAGLCGDVFLVSTPTGARLGDLRVRTSVQKGELSFDVDAINLPAQGKYMARVMVFDNHRAIANYESPSLASADLNDGHFSWTVKWKPDRLWDIHTPYNQFEAQASLVEAHGMVLDIGDKTRFGFRELSISGRDFYLNGTRIFISAVPFDNAVSGAAAANYAAACESMRRLKSIGINFVYSHNYDCQPGSNLSYDEILRAADDTGMLFALTAPHFGQYDWKTPGAEENNGYRRDAQFWTHVALNHPSVVCYSTSHNGCGYSEDMNPDMIAAGETKRDRWSLNNSKSALRVQDILNKLDPSRIVYHHAGGNIGALHSMNFYLNWVPTQELSDWYGPWASQGTKPVFMCEYGVPFSWDAAMYRGWYNGQRAFGNARVPWEYCLAEWDSQFLGDRAFNCSELERNNLRFEDYHHQRNVIWHRWDYPTEVGSNRFDDSNTVKAIYMADNWRAFRTWGVSGVSPWEFGDDWTVRRGVDRHRKDLTVDWDNLQRPGYSPDYIDDRFERMDMAFEAADWIPTPAGKIILRDNQPILAYIAGKADAFTEKGHNFLPGESVQKQLILINNSRQTVSFQCDWSLGLPKPIAGGKTVTIETGQQVRIPLEFALPADLPAGAYTLKSSVKFATGAEQADSFTIHVLVAPAKLSVAGKVALFDPSGESAALLKDAGIAFSNVTDTADLSAFEVLVIGKHALTPDGPAPDLARVRDGLKVVMLEQSSAGLEKRLGFRVVEYGLRQAFKRVADHPILNGIDTEHLRDWRGEATLVSSRLTYDRHPQQDGPSVNWCDIPVTRRWRCGNRGNIASVLIEKPARGDFMPIIDGGYSLQYSPLMEFHEGRGMILFCQLDITGRTEADPAARTMAANLFSYVSKWKPQPFHEATYVGDAIGLKHLQSCGFHVTELADGSPDPSKVLILAPGCAQKLAGRESSVKTFAQNGGKILAIALDQKSIAALIPGKVATTIREHINCVFDAPGGASLLAGIGPADVHNRSPRRLPLITGGATVVGDGILGLAPADAGNPNIVFCQMAPWQFDYARQFSLKRTYRRSTYTLTRLMDNLGVSCNTPLLERFVKPTSPQENAKRFLDGLYLDAPEEMDDPYRFFRW